MRECAGGACGGGLCVVRESVAEESVVGSVWWGVCCRRVCGGGVCGGGVCGGGYSVIQHPVESWWTMRCGLLFVDGYVIAVPIKDLNNTKQENHYLILKIGSIIAMV